MPRTGVLALILALAAGGAGASDKADKPDGGKQLAKPQAATGPDTAELIQQAAHKAVAGDSDGAIELLTKAAATLGLARTLRRADRPAEALGQQDATLLQYLARVEKGEPVE